MQKHNPKLILFFTTFFLRLLRNEDLNNCEIQAHEVSCV